MAAFYCRIHIPARHFSWWLARFIQVPVLQNIMDSVYSGLGLRLVFVGISILVDKYSRLRYTDIDYDIYSSAANYITQGDTPYATPTYRYSPLLALLLLPNGRFPAFGKVLFSLADALISLVLHNILEDSFRLPAVYCQRIALLWAINPITIIIATRGSCDSISNLLFLYTLLLLSSKSYTISGVFYGFLIHFRLFHIIYSPALALYILRDHATPPRSPRRLQLLTNLNWRQAVLFTTATCFTFTLLFYISYTCYGEPYLQQALLYHLTRSDFRHNLSPMFLPMYLTSPPLAALRYITFLPQTLLLFALTLTLARKHYLFLCLFLQTLCFVTFNKVCTAQYFTWYLCLFPLIAHQLTMTWRAFVTIGVLLSSTLALTLYRAYLLEFEGIDTFLSMWWTALLFHLANVMAIIAIICNFK